MSRSSTPNLRRTPPPVWNSSPTHAIEVVDAHVDVAGKELNAITAKQLNAVAESVLSMDASRNHFATLDFLKHLPRIFVLNASYNRLRRIFSIVYAKATLTHVDLSHNAIGTVEHFLSQMVHLRVLNLSFNQLMVGQEANYGSPMCHWC
uniref:Leucine-rich repeat-containing protein 51 n=1 Tax=Panagrellus redivivus TaxID=6233 RepID=A0A7E4UXH8_PANRE